MYKIENQLAEWLTNLTGVFVVPEKDNDLRPELLNSSHGVLRLISDDHGVNDEFYTESAGYAVDFIILKEESEKFVNTIHKIGTEYNTVDLTTETEIAFENGIKGKFYFTNCLINGEIESANGHDMMSYQMLFDIALFEDLIPSDDAEILINDSQLRGIVSAVPTFSVDKEGFVVQGNTLPKYQESSKNMIIQVQFMPLKDNVAAKLLLSKMGNLDTESFNVSFEWPKKNTLVNIKGEFYLKDITLNLVKGNFAGVNATLVMEDS